MACQRNGKSGRKSYSAELRNAITHLLPRHGLPAIVDNRKQRWTPRLLAVMALLMAWAGCSTAQESFEWGRAIVVKMYRWRRRPGKTLAGLVKALAANSRMPRKLIVPHLRRKMRRRCGRSWRWRGWVVLAGDGSKINCPRTKANQRGLGCGGKDKSGPQMMLTTIFHVASGLPWDWRRGGARCAERTLLRRMLRDLPPYSLLLLDAGFTGYDLLQELIAAEHSFIIRVGRNVQLLRHLGYHVEARKDTVYLWPENRRQCQPLALRCVRNKKGKRRMCLLTNVHDRRKLSDAEMVKWYHRRWMIETSYRSLKQTMGKRTMLSRKPSHARFELDWAMLGLWMLGLAATAAQPRRQLGRWSAATSLKTVRRAMRQPDRLPPSGGLTAELRRAVTDNYKRSSRKNARRWPHKKNDRPCGMPKIRTATPTEVQRAQSLLAAAAGG